MNNKCFYFIKLLLYVLVLKHLPPTYYPGGSVIKAVRYFFCKGLFKSCGRGVVIDPNALLGAVKMGDNIMMGPDVIILSNNHVFDSRLLPMRLQGKTEDDPGVIYEGTLRKWKL